MDVHSFSEIEDRRVRLGISQAELCSRADVNETTYARHKQAATDPTPRVRRKLGAALAEMAEERGVILVEEVRHAAE